MNFPSDLCLCNNTFVRTQTELECSARQTPPEDLAVGSPAFRAHYMLAWHSWPQSGFFWNIYLSSGETHEQHSFITQHSIQHPPRRQPRSFMEHLSKRNCFITTDLWMPLAWETESPRTVQKLPFVSPDAKLLPSTRLSQHWKYSQLATANAKIRAHFQVFPVTVQRGKQGLVSNTECIPQWYNQSREAHTHLIASAPPSWLPWLSQLVRP